MKAIVSNLITDTSFEMLGDAASRWAIVTHQGVAMLPTVENAVLRLEVNGTSGANWHGELRYAPITVSRGETLTVSFAARAERPFTFSVWLGQMNSPHASLVAPENHFGEKLLTPEWQSYSHIWTVISSETAARLNFVLGQIDNVVEIKDVQLHKNG